jgi:hypothetical protein
MLVQAHEIDVRASAQRIIRAERYRVPFGRARHRVRTGCLPEGISLVAEKCERRRQVPCPVEFDVVEACIERQALAREVAVFELRMCGQSDVIDNATSIAGLLPESSISHQVGATIGTRHRFQNGGGGANLIPVRTHRAAWSCWHLRQQARKHRCRKRDNRANPPPSAVVRS